MNNILYLFLQAINQSHISEIFVHLLEKPKKILKKEELYSRKHDFYPVSTLTSDAETRQQGTTHKYQCLNFDCMLKLKLLIL